MNDLNKLDLLCDDHSCKDCQEEIYCNNIGSICSKWKEQDETVAMLKQNIDSDGYISAMLVYEAGKELQREIDRLAMEKINEKRS